MTQIGRIGGPLLEEDLIRNGVDIAFRNTLSTTQLLYIDVNNRRIGVNLNNPSYELEIFGTTRTNTLLINTADFPYLTISDNTITAKIGDIELNAAEAIVMATVDNGTLFIDSNYIATTQSNANIDIIPNGTGEVDVVSNLNVYGNLFTTGDITLDGTITFGNSNTDAIDFNADVNSDIIPDQSNIYSLGSTTNRWDNVYTNLVNGQVLSTDTLTVGLIDYTLEQGNIIYVAQNGDDTNRGSHILAPVSSIKRALELVDASIGAPTVVYIFPGDYEEETPLVVPSNVSVIGTDLRNVKVFPTSYTQSEDVFHLNGETTIQNITVKNFYYDSVNNTGNAFRFAPGAVISSRSPYIQNVSVITNTELAGRGAYIDGAELNSSSVDASMLFHSCTFITPDADAITMTNGVRVEWLNSFTYFANRGLYAFNGPTGRVGNDGSTVNYGAEVRSIGSANVYGNYGAVADGSDCLMYLIQHNFAYIGLGLDSSNDESLVIQVNEVVEENSGQIHYVTTDHTGSFRVGDNFFVDFKTGNTTIDLSSVTADSLTGLVITTGVNRTSIIGERIETGNIKISSNLIETLVDNLNLVSATGELNLNNTSQVLGDLDVAGNLTFGGNLNLLGNQVSDTLTFNTDVNSDIIPNQSNIYNLGSPSNTWLEANVLETILDNIRIYDNVIETTESNSNLELRASGTGLVTFKNSTNIDNDLTVIGSLYGNNITINGNLLQSGLFNLIGSATIGGIVTVENTLSVNQSTTFEEILIDDNFITTISSNSDLELRASDTGIVKFLNPVETGNNLLTTTVDTSLNFIVDVNTTFNVADISSIRIENNSITTTVSNANLELRANEPNEIRFVNNVIVEQDLDVVGTIYFNDTTIDGNVIHNGQRTISGNYELFSDLIVDGIIVKDNFISTTESNSDLEIRASGTGKVIISELDITNDLLIFGNTFLQNIAVNGTIVQTGDRTQTGNYSQVGDLLLSGNLSVGSNAQFENLAIEGTVLKSTVSNSNLELIASGTGIILIPANNTQINNNLFAASIVAENITVDGDLALNEIIIPPSIIEIDDNFITTKVSNADLELRATKSFILFEGGNSLATSEINLDGGIATTLTFTSIFDGGNVAEADSNQTVVLVQNNTILNQNLSVAGTTFLNNTSILGSLEHIGDKTQTGNILLTGLLNTSGASNFSSKVQFENISIDQNILQTTASNSDLELRASGAGNVVIPNNNVEILQNASAGQVTTNNVIIDGSFAFDLIEVSTDIQIFDNVITTANSNSDLELRASGTGSILIKDLYVKDSEIQTLLSDITFSSPIVVIDATGALKIPTGPVAPTEQGTIKFNTATGFFEGKNNEVITLSELYSTNRRTSVLAHPTNNTINLTVNNAVVGTVAATGLSIHEIQVDNITLRSKNILTTLANPNLELTAPGSRSIVIDNIAITDNVIANRSTGLLTISNTGFGKVKFNGNAIAIPVGTTAERSINPPIGDTRWNTTASILESWDGNQYISAAGISEVISEEQFNDLLLEYTLVFG